MRKLLAIIAAAAVILSFAACSKEDDSAVTEVESIKISDIELTTDDKDVVIEYTLLPEGAESEVTITVADERIATVEDGKITAVSEGETEMLITAGNIGESVKVTVTKPGEEKADEDKAVVENKDGSADVKDSSRKNSGSTGTTTSSKANTKSAATPAPARRPVSTPAPEQKPAENTPAPAPAPAPEQKPAETPQPTPEPTPAPTPAPVATCPICGSTEHTTHPPIDINQNIGDGYHPGPSSESIFEE